MPVELDQQIERYKQHNRKLNVALTVMLVLAVGNAIASVLGAPPVLTWALVLTLGIVLVLVARSHRKSSRAMDQAFREAWNKP